MLNESKISACQLRWSFYDRISRFQDCLQSLLFPRGRQKQTKNEKRSHFSCIILQTASCLGHDLKKKVWEMETTLKGWRWGGLLLQFAAMLDTSIKSPTTATKKRKEKKNNLTMQPQGFLDFLLRRIRRKLFKDMTFPNHPFDKSFAVDSLLFSHLLKHFPFSVQCTINLWWQS